MNMLMTQIWVSLEGKTGIFLKADIYLCIWNLQDRVSMPGQNKSSSSVLTGYDTVSTQTVLFSTGEESILQ